MQDTFIILSFFFPTFLPTKRLSWGEAFYFLCILAVVPYMSLVFFIYGTFSMDLSFPYSRQVSFDGFTTSAAAAQPNTVEVIVSISIALRFDGIFPASSFCRRCHRRRRCHHCHRHRYSFH